MRQVLQSLKTGEVTVSEIPTPVVRSNCLLVRSSRSLVSAGTERMLLDFGRAGWIEKARKQPDKVREVLEKLKTDGLAATIDVVRSKLDEPLALGYSNVGEVTLVGNGVRGFAPGDRVVSNGPHAELVVVPHTLAARVPDEVTDDEAAFTVVASIALQGVRLAQPTLGECFVVSGLGLIGLLAVQLIRAHGCHVLGIDPDPAKVELARSFGAKAICLNEGEDPIAAAMELSRGRGVDGVLLTLASSSDEPISQAARMCRKRGRLVLVGVTGLKLNRADFYEKELTFQVSASYGPGRYDPNYEQRGQDYPLGFVRWTAQRNFEAVLDMMARGSLNVKPLITHRFAIDDAPKAYDLLATGREPYLGILLEYPGNVRLDAQTVAINVSSSRVGEISREIGEAGRANLCVIGAGNYAGRVLIPALKNTKATLVAIANTGGITAAHYGRRYGFRYVTTDIESLINHPNIDTVVIATRHDSHARLVVDALRAGKHTFVEKPLALNLAELDEIRRTWMEAPQGKRKILMVGFNRRFAPLVERMKRLLAGVREPKTFVVTVNAGFIPTDHWTQDPQVGGGRLIGEACHFIDLLRYLADAQISSWHVQTISGRGLQVKDDKATIVLNFADGSIGTIHYFANGHKGFPKERIEVFGAGRVLQLDNFRVLRGWGWPGFRTLRQWRQDKGHSSCVNAFVEAVRSGGPAPIPFDELMEVSRVTVEIGEAARKQH